MSCALTPPHPNPQKSQWLCSSPMGGPCCTCSPPLQHTPTTTTVISAFLYSLASRSQVSKDQVYSSLVLPLPLLTHTHTHTHTHIKCTNTHIKCTNTHIKCTNTHKHRLS